MRKESLLWTSFRKRSQWRSAIRAVRLQASLEVARCLIEEMGLDINAIDSHGATPLRYAGRDRDLEVVQRLSTEKGVDMTARDHAGATPLRYATRLDLAVEILEKI